MTSQDYANQQVTVITLITKTWKQTTHTINQHSTKPQRIIHTHLYGYPGYLLLKMYSNRLKTPTTSTKPAIAAAKQYQTAITIIMTPKTTQDLTFLRTASACRCCLSEKNPTKSDGSV